MAVIPVEEAISLPSSKVEIEAIQISGQVKHFFIACKNFKTDQTCITLKKLRGNAFSTAFLHGYSLYSDS
jgi:hypothetical protein